jgi:Putative amidase domain
MDNESFAALQQELHEIKQSINEIRQPWYLESIADELSKMRLVPIDQIFKVETEDYKLETFGTLPYDASAALAYATTYCGQNNNNCGKFYDSDCAHFMSHCLAAGGIGVTGLDPAASCPAGLCIRAEELAAAFYNASSQFSNIKQLNGYEDGRRGDYGFLRKLIEKSHAFLLAGTPSADSGLVYAHTTNHCGDNMDTLRIYFGAYYRIE